MYGRGKVSTGGTGGTGGTVGTRGRGRREGREGMFRVAEWHLELTMFL